MSIQLALSSTRKQRPDRKDIRRSYIVVILVCVGTFIAVVLFSLLGPGLICQTLDGSTYRAGINVEDHWGNARKPEISFNKGWYYWVTGSDVIMAGTYECMAGRIVTQHGWTFQLSATGTVLTVDGITYRRVILNLNK